MCILFHWSDDDWTYSGRAALWQGGNTYSIPAVLMRSHFPQQHGYFSVTQLQRHLMEDTDFYMMWFCHGHWNATMQRDNTFLHADSKSAHHVFFCCIIGLVSDLNYHMQSSPVYYHDVTNLELSPLFFYSCVRRHCPMGTSRQFSTAAVTTAPHSPPSNCSSLETLQTFGRLYATFATNNRQEDCM